jgi:hypothetical protein
MYVSRLLVATQPGNTHAAEEKLKELRDLVAQAGGKRPRVLRGHYGSPGSPDLIFEQEASDLAELEREIGTVTSNERFQTLSRELSGLLAATPKREVYRLIE